MPVPVLDVRTLNRTLLARQLLLERATMDPLMAIDHLVGLQAQEPRDPYVGLWSRLSSFSPGTLSAALLERRAVRIVLMRATIHLVTAADATALRPVMQPVLDRELFANPTWAQGLRGADVDAAVALASDLVRQRPRTLAELRTEIARRWPDIAPSSVASLAYAARNLLPMVQVPPRGLWDRSGHASMTTLGDWTGLQLASDGAPDRTLLRYLAAYGPATAADAAAWSRLTGLRPAIDRLRPRLRVYRDDRGRELFDHPNGPIVDAATPVPVRFLPQYDNVALGHRDRRRIMPDASRHRSRDRLGVARLLVDGFVAGLWWIERAESRATLVVEPFNHLAPGVRRTVEDEGGRLLAFVAAGAAADLRVEVTA